MEDITRNELFIAYLDGELTAEEQAQVERLLAENADARQLMDELRALSSTLQSMPQYTLGEDIHQRVLQMAEQRMQGEKKQPEEEESPTAERPAAATARHLAQRFLQPRALVWSGTAIALAIAVTFFNPDRPRPGAESGPIAMTQESGEESADRVEPSIGAAPDGEAMDMPTVPEGVSFGDFAEQSAPGEDAIAEPSLEPATGLVPMAKPGGEVFGTRGGGLLKGRGPAKSAAKRAPAGPGKIAGKGGYGYGAGDAQPALGKDGVTGGPYSGTYGSGGTRADISGGATARNAKRGVDPLLKQKVPGYRDSNGVAVIRCSVSRRAMDARALHKALLAAGITPDDSPVANSGKLAAQAEIATDTGGRTDLKVAGAKSSGVKMLYVDATSEQIEAALLAMARQPGSFHAVSVRPVPEVQEQRRWKDFDSGGVRPQGPGMPTTTAVADAPAREQKKSQREFKSDSRGEGRPDVATADKPFDQSVAPSLDDPDVSPSSPSMPKTESPPATRPSEAIPLVEEPSPVERPLAEAEEAADEEPAAVEPSETEEAAEEEPAEEAESATEKAAEDMIEGTLEEQPATAPVPEAAPGGGESPDEYDRDADAEIGDGQKRLEDPHSGAEQPESDTDEATKNENTAAKEMRQKGATDRADSSQPTFGGRQAEPPVPQHATEMPADQGGGMQQTVQPIQPTTKPTYRVLFVIEVLDTDSPAEAAEPQAPPVEAKGRQ